LAALVPVLGALEPALVPGLLVTPPPALPFSVPLVEPSDIELLPPPPACTVWASAMPEPASESAKAALRILRFIVDLLDCYPMIRSDPAGLCD
jgi:hypothetical protein